MTIIYALPVVHNAWAETAPVWNGTSGDIADPGNTYTAAGWTKNTTPPQYQYFNWILNYCSNAVRYFMQNGIVSWQAAETYQSNAVVQYGGYFYQSQQNGNTNNAPPTNLGSTVFWAPLTGYATVAMLLQYVTTTQLNAALVPYASKNSPSFTGVPIAPTPLTNSTSSQVATTAFTQSAITAALGVYLTGSQAAALYLTIANAAATYLTQAAAAAAYLTQSNAASTYATQTLVKGGATKASYVRQVLPSGVIYIDGVTQSLSQGANSIGFPGGGFNTCVSVSLTPFGNSAAYALTSITPGGFTMNTGAGVPFHYHAAGY